MRRIACVLLLSLAAGCGGKTERSPEDGLPEPSGGEPGSGGDPADPSWPSEKLGQCKAGTPIESTPSCQWVAEGYCFPDKGAACNCVCPSDHDSVCMSGYPEPGKPALVSCH